MKYPAWQIKTAEPGAEEKTGRCRLRRTAAPGIGGPRRLQ